MSNYSMLSYLSKTVLIFDMLAGRLELFPILVLLLRRERGNGIRHYGSRRDHGGSRE